MGQVRWIRACRVWLIYTNHNVTFQMFTTCWLWNGIGTFDEKPSRLSTGLKLKCWNKSLPQHAPIYVSHLSWARLFSILFLVVWAHSMSFLGNFWFQVGTFPILTFLNNTAHIMYWMPQPWSWAKCHLQGRVAQVMKFWVWLDIST